MISKLLKASWDCNVLITGIKHDDLTSIGIKTLFLDVDGTLLPRSDKEVDQSVIEWVREAKVLFHIHLISNNPSRNRIKNIADQLNLDFTYRAGKPRRKSLYDYISNNGLSNSEAAIIGDRIFTDILVGNRLGIYTILVNKIGSYGNANRNNVLNFLESVTAKFLMRLKL